MGDPMPDSIRKIWGDWKIRGFVLFSFSLQTLLILCAPLRKRTSNSWIRSIIWLAYVLANFVANFAIGLIASSQGGGWKPAQSTDVHLLAFWAPFLLIHIGGPDTIISFSLKDNALWQRHLLGPLFQVVATLTVFTQSLGLKNKLSFPTLVLFLTGIIKCEERTRALYLGSLDGLKSSVKEDEYRCHNNIGVVQSTLCHINDVPRELCHHPYPENNIGVVQCAHYFFEHFSKGLIADLLFSSKACRQQASTSVFIGKCPKESFHIIAAELNFIYETLFTKLYVAHTKLGYFFRALSFSATSIALVCFYILDKHGLHRFDVVITYTLIFGSMALDSIALFMLIFSDWTVAAAQELLSKGSWQSSCVISILLKYLDLKRPKLYSSNTTSSFLEWSRQILFGRCSESIYTFNLIDYALKESRKTTPKTISLFRGCLQYFRRQPSSEGEGGVSTLGGRQDGRCFGLKDLLDKFKYRSSTPLSQDLWDFIFYDIREKKNNIDANNDLECCQLWEGRGNWILQCNHRNGKGNCKGLSKYIVDYDYEESLILWHIATELCYNTDKSNAGVGNRRREYSKTLSDYMLYLLFMQPSIMSSVTRIGQHALSDTCANAQNIFLKNLEPAVLEHEEACNRILEAWSSNRDKYDKSAFLFVACDLVKALNKLGDNKWDLMSQVWVELLSYAASHCRPNSFAQSLSKGGELVAFVWLLMEHLQVRPK